MNNDEEIKIGDVVYPIEDMWSSDDLEKFGLELGKEYKVEGVMHGFWGTTPSLYMKTSKGSNSFRSEYFRKKDPLDTFVPTEQTNFEFWTKTVADLTVELGKQRKHKDVDRIANQLIIAHYRLNKEANLRKAYMDT